MGGTEQRKKKFRTKNISTSVRHYKINVQQKQKQNFLGQKYSIRVAKKRLLWSRKKGYKEKETMVFTPSIGEVEKIGKCERIAAGLDFYIQDFLHMYIYTL